MKRFKIAVCVEWVVGGNSRNCGWQGVVRGGGGAKKGVTGTAADVAAIRTNEGLVRANLAVENLNLVIVWRKKTFALTRSSFIFKIAVKNLG
jgi:hypothetical protein